MLAPQRLEVADQLRERYVEAVREFEHDAEGLVDLAALDRSDVVAVQAGALADSLGIARVVRAGSELRDRVREARATVW